MIGRYLADRPEQEFFVARFVDYADDDGLFRKYRIVFVDGRPYACHMAIADRWDIWYLNAGMAFSESKRLEEERFMRDFDSDFAVRHQGALAAIADRIGLDYFTIDCAENQNGELLDIRGRQHRGRPQHGFAGGVSLQAAADAQDLRRLRGDAVSPRPARPGARGVTLPRGRRSACEIFESQAEAAITAATRLEICGSRNALGGFTRLFTSNKIRCTSASSAATFSNARE